MRVPRSDYLFEAEKIIEVDGLIKDNNWHLKLIKADKAKKFEFICKYTPIAI